MARPLRAFFAVMLAFGLFGCDHATKAIATQTLARAVSIEPGILELHYVRNDDVAFNAFQRLGVPHSPLFLSAVMLVALATAIGFTVVGQRRSPSRLDLIGGACIIGGALGNVADRIARGFVVDFIHVRGWPVFNVADIAVIVGVGLLALSRMKKRRVA